MNRPSHTTVRNRGMTLMEASISVGLIGVALAVCMQMLVTTSTNMDIEMNESDMAVRTSGRMYDLTPDLECASTADIRIFNTGGAGSPDPAYLVPAVWPSTASSTPRDGMVLTNGSMIGKPIGDTIAFHILTYVQSTNTGTSTNTAGATSIVTGSSTSTDTGTAVATGLLMGNIVCYHWAPMKRGGITDPNLGMLVKDVYVDSGLATNQPWWAGGSPPAPVSTMVVEENLVPCNFALYLNGASPTSTTTAAGVSYIGYPTGFAVFQGGIENAPGTSAKVSKQAVARQRMLTVCLQRAQSTVSLAKINVLTNVLTGTLTSTAITTGSALSQTVQTIYLKTP
jgi:hypothetical protein